MREEHDFGNRVLVRGDAVGIEIDKMNDSEVDLTDLIAVVVEQGDDALAPPVLNRKFLCDLPLDPGQIACRVRGRRRRRPRY